MIKKAIFQIKTLSLTFLTLLITTTLCFASEESGEAIKTGLELARFGLAIASGIGIAIAAFGGAFGQSRAITSAMEGISRNPAAQEKMFLPLILGLVFIESLVIYAFVISIFLQGKI